MSDNDNLAAEIQRDLNPQAAIEEAFTKYDAERRRDEELAAKAAGCTVDELRAARKFQMPIDEYVGYSGATTAADAARVEAEGEAIRKAQAEAEYQRLVEEMRP